MEFFNIGPFEFLIILVIMFVLLGPDEMKRTARRIAVSIRKLVRSPMWAEITGMREEIRELPKRLLEDTGLEEAVEDIKQTTTAAANEMNTAVKESVEAARVRDDVEELRKNTQKLSPNAGHVIMPPRLAPSEEEPASSPEVQEVDVEPAPREPAQDQPVAETANSIMPPAEVVKKPRRKKAVETDVTAAAEGEPPAAKPRRAPRRKIEVEPTATPPGKNGSAAEETSIAKDETNESNAA